MLEVEMKFPITHNADLEQKLHALGAVYRETLHEADHYVNAPDRDFAQTDEALRLRQANGAVFLTYKGPKTDTQTKTRTEIEVPLASGDRVADDCLRLLTRLGYRPVAVVRKERRTYRLSRGGFEVEVCLDHVEGVGHYVELEIVAAEEKFEAARAAIQGLAAELGLSNSERRSYLQLLLTGKSRRE
jgi:adenylate cyclase class 2